MPRCLGCPTELPVRSDQGAQLVYCSKSCGAHHRYLEKKAGRWKGGTVGERRSCERCGRKYIRRQAAVQKYCSRRCWGNTRNDERRVGPPLRDRRALANKRAKEIKLAMSQGMIGYLAGIIDADGFVALHRLDGGGPQLVIGAGMSDREPIRLLRAFFGGHIWNKRVDHPKHKRIYDWKIGGWAAFAAILVLRPYLRVKAKRATLGLFYQRTRRLQWGTGRSVPPTELAFRERCFIQMARMNQRGPTRKQYDPRHKGGRWEA